MDSINDFWKSVKKDMSIGSKMTWEQIVKGSIYCLAKYSLLALFLWIVSKFFSINISL